MMTFSALDSASTVSSTVVFVTSPSIFFWACGAGAIPPKRTFVRDRFMATHYMVSITKLTDKKDKTYHDVRQNRTANTYQGSNAGKKWVVEHESFSYQGKSGVGVQHGNDNSCLS